MITSILALESQILEQFHKFLEKKNSKQKCIWSKFEMKTDSEDIWEIVTA